MPSMRSPRPLGKSPGDIPPSAFGFPLTRLLSILNSTRRTGGREVEGARLESDPLHTHIVTKHHTFPDRTHNLSHFPSPNVTLEPLTCTLTGSADSSHAFNRGRAGVPPTPPLRVMSARQKTTLYPPFDSSGAPYQVDPRRGAGDASCMLPALLRQRRDTP